MQSIRTKLDYWYEGDSWGSLKKSKGKRKRSIRTRLDWTTDMREVHRDDWKGKVKVKVKVKGRRSIRIRLEDWKQSIRTILYYTKLGYNRLLRWEGLID